MPVSTGPVRRPPSVDVIGAWLAVAVLVVGAAGAVGRELEDSFEVPGLDSQRAAELLERAGSDRAGLTAQVVVTPRDGRRLRLARGAGRARAARAEVRRCRTCSARATRRGVRRTGAVARRSEVALSGARGR